MVWIWDPRKWTEKTDSEPSKWDRFMTEIKCKRRQRDSADSEQLMTEVRPTTLLLLVYRLLVNVITYLYKRQRRGPAAMNKIPKYMTTSNRHQGS